MGRQSSKPKKASARRGAYPWYNALDPITHCPIEPDPRFAADLSFLKKNRLPDREARVERAYLKDSDGTSSPARPALHF